MLEIKPRALCTLGEDFTHLATLPAMMNVLFDFKLNANVNVEDLMKTTLMGTLEVR